MPPDAASYQAYVPPGAVAVNVVEVPVHIEVPEAVGAAGTALTVTVTAVLGPTQPETVV